MASALWVNPTACSRPNNWLSACVPTITVRRKLIYLSRKTSLEYALGRFEYNTDLFDDGTIARMVGHWQTLLEAIIQDPTLRISDLPILSENEQKQLLEQWNATQTTYPAEKCVHQLFEEQVQRRPEAVALIYENQTMTYRELNERANQLAHCLIRLGVET